MAKRLNSEVAERLQARANRIEQRPLSAAAWVRQIFDQISAFQAKGLCYREIADILNEEGISLKDGKPWTGEMLALAVGREIRTRTGTKKWTWKKKAQPTDTPEPQPREVPE